MALDDQPPFLQSRACSRLNATPHPSQVAGILSKGRWYLIPSASRNSVAENRSGVYTVAILLAMQKFYHQLNVEMLASSLHPRYKEYSLVWPGPDVKYYSAY